MLCPSLNLTIWWLKLLMLTTSLYVFIVSCDFHTLTYSSCLTSFLTTTFDTPLTVIWLVNLQVFELCFRLAAHAFHLSTPLAWILTDRSALCFVWSSHKCHNVWIKRLNKQYLSRADCMILRRSCGWCCNGTSIMHNLLRSKSQCPDKDLLVIYKNLLKSSTM